MPNNAIKSLSTGKFLFSYSPNRVKISIINLNKEVLLTLHERILLEHKNLEKKIQSLKNQLLTLPDGKLIVTRNKNHYKWYVSDGKTSTYLPKKQRRLAEQLALKKYLTLELEDALQKKTALGYYLRHHPCDSDNAKKLLTEIPEFQTLLSSHFNPHSQESDNWMHSAYEKNNNFPEQLTHQTGFGYAVRSKSELLIDYALHVNNIPFRYEAALTLENTTLYPDFTIKLPETDKIIYWEHFGLMDDPAYCKNVLSKLKLYMSNGIIPNINLITTYETGNEPLDTKQVNDMIQLFLK